jgi:hypothetical protein
MIERQLQPLLRALQGLLIRQSGVDAVIGCADAGGDAAAIDCDCECAIALDFAVRVASDDCDGAGILSVSAIVIGDDDGDSDWLEAIDCVTSVAAAHSCVSSWLEDAICTAHQERTASGQQRQGIRA